MRGRRGTAVAIAVVVALAVVLAAVRHGAPSCHPRAPTGRGPAWLLGALTDVPCPSSGAAVYAAADDRHAPMDVLDPIADPRGGYLGVYHAPLPDHRLEIVLARSRDLLHWHRLRVLEPGASMPTLRAVPGGYLLADERSGRRDTVELHWFDSLDAVLNGSPSRSLDLPLRYSTANNGTPAFVSVAWHGGLAASQIALTFHYQSAAGPDREAFGVLSGFKRWRTRRDAGTDALLDRQGFLGSHGDQRWFGFAGQTWRILEAQSRAGSFASWHVLLYDPSARRFAPLTMNTLHGRFGASFGNPTAQVLPAPDGRGEVLVVTMFVFNQGPGAADAGELVFLRPVP